MENNLEDTMSFGQFIARLLVIVGILHFGRIAYLLVTNKHQRFSFRRLLMWPWNWNPLRRRNPLDWEDADADRLDSVPPDEEEPELLGGVIVPRAGPEPEPRDDRPTLCVTPEATAFDPEKTEFGVPALQLAAALHSDDRPAEARVNDARVGLELELVKEPLPEPTTAPPNATFPTMLLGSGLGLPKSPPDIVVIDHPSDPPKEPTKK